MIVFSIVQFVVATENLIENEIFFREFFWGSKKKMKGVGE